jgi:hypothetical protein
MKKFVVAISAIAVAVLLMCASSSQAVAAPGAEITLLNPPSEPLVLEVGESYTFEILVESDEPFIWAMAMTDAYYPGRGMHWHGGDRATQDTSATLQLTMTGKKSTAGLPAVCDWPEPGDCWPEGVAPASIVVGVRYKGGQVVAETFAFGVVVP